MIAPAQLTDAILRTAIVRALLKSSGMAGLGDTPDLTPELCSPTDMECIVRNDARQRIRQVVWENARRVANKTRCEDNERLNNYRFDYHCEQYDPLPVPTWEEALAAVEADRARFQSSPPVSSPVSSSSAQQHTTPERPVSSPPPASQSPETPPSANSRAASQQSSARKTTDGEQTNNDEKTLIHIGSPNLRFADHTVTAAQAGVENILTKARFVPTWLWVVVAAAVIIWSDKK